MHLGYFKTAKIILNWEGHTIIVEHTKKQPLLQENKLLNHCGAEQAPWAHLRRSRSLKTLKYLTNLVLLKANYISFRQIAGFVGNSQLGEGTFREWLSCGFHKAKAYHITSRLTKWHKGMLEAQYVGLERVRFTDAIFNLPALCVVKTKMLPLLNLSQWRHHLVNFSS